MKRAQLKNGTFEINCKCEYTVVADIDLAAVVRSDKGIVYEWICKHCGRIYQEEPIEIIKLDVKDNKLSNKQENTIPRGKVSKSDSGDSEEVL